MAVVEVTTAEGKLLQECVFHLIAVSPPASKRSASGTYSLALTFFIFSAGVLRQQL
jgi:hypothetical protein